MVFEGHNYNGLKVIFLIENSMLNITTFTRAKISLHQVPREAHY